MKVILGLGNPGRKYEGTRHNVGFDVVAVLAKKFGLGPPRTAFQAEVVEASLAGEKALLVAPQTFMNLSGQSAVGLRDFYKLDNTDLLVVCDDFHLPLGRLRLRGQGSAGGQNGLANVIQRLGADNVPRLRIGVGPVPAGWSTVDFVLGRFAKDQLPDAEVSIAEAADAAVIWATSGLAAAMNRYNAPGA